MSIMDNWLIPMTNRNHSGAANQNFLWNSENVYIMDNHRAAMWCWLQHMTKSDKYNLLHVDMHTDCRANELSRWIKHLPDLTKIDLQSYLDLTLPPGSDGERYPVIFWDNFLSIFLKCFGGEIDECLFCTHGLGDPPNHTNINDYPIFNLPNYLEIFTEENSNLIIDIDLDFFFSRQGDNSELLFSDNYIELVFRYLKEAMRRGKVAVLTLALSPECSGGWERAESLCAKVCKSLEIDFELPK